MALWWSYGGYEFPDVVNQTIWHFKGNLTFKVKVNRQSYTPVILPKVVCTCGPNLVILAWMGDELWCGQAQDEVNVDFWGEFEFEVQGRLPLNVFCIFGQNVVILGWTGLELLDRHVSYWYTHTRTHRQMQATTIPEGWNWPWVKSHSSIKYTIYWHPIVEWVAIIQMLS